MVNGRRLAGGRRPTATGTPQKHTRTTPQSSCLRLCIRLRGSNPAAPHPSSPPLPSDIARAATGHNTASKSWWKQRWALAVAALLTLLAALAIMTGASKPDSAENRTDAVAGESPADAPRSPDEDTAPSEPEAQVSTRDDAFAYDASVPVVFSRPGEADGSVWNVQVAAPRDITDVVMAKNNSFDDAPPEGVRFVGFDVEMTLASAKTEPLRTGINFSWELLGGSTDAIYDSRTMEDVVECRRAPNELGIRDEVFVGGTIAGVVCIPLPTEDLDSPDTAVAMNFDGDRVVFAINGARPDPAEVAQSRQGFIGRPLGYGSPVPVTLGGQGRSARSVWNVTVGEPRDVSDVFAQDNDFNDPALDGVTFLGSTWR